LMTPPAPLQGVKREVDTVVRQSGEKIWRPRPRQAPRSFRGGQGHGAAGARGRKEKRGPSKRRIAERSKNSEVPRRSGCRPMKTDGWPSRRIRRHTRVDPRIHRSSEHIWRGIDGVTVKPGEDDRVKSAQKSTHFCHFANLGREPRHVRSPPPLRGLLRRKGPRCGLNFWKTGLNPMATSRELKATTRRQAASGAAGQKRRDGRVPGVIYGNNQPPVTISGRGFRN